MRKDDVPLVVVLLLQQRCDMFNDPVIDSVKIVSGERVVSMGQIGIEVIGKEPMPRVIPKCTILLPELFR